MTARMLRRHVRDAVVLDSAPPRPAARDVRSPATAAGRPPAIAYVFLIGYALLCSCRSPGRSSRRSRPTGTRCGCRSSRIPFTLQGWERFPELDPSIPQLFFNSVIVAAGVTVSNLVLASMAGYAFARLRFPGREILFLAILGTLMIPDQLRFVPST